MNRIKTLPWGTIALVGAAFLAGWLIKSPLEPKAPVQVREDSPEYKYINPLLLVDNSDIKFDDYDALKSQVERRVSRAVEDGEATKMSFYFRGSEGKWTGVNEKELYAPSSMLKIVTMLAYLHQAEKDPTVLGKRFYYEYKSDSGQYYKPRKVLEPGYYTVRELIVQMISQSDNTAMHVLNSQNADEVIDVYKDLKLPDPLTPGIDFMSPESYSHVWRTLYSSTYLSRTYSEEALKLLSTTDFKDGLAAGVGSTTIAQKFGEQTIKNQTGAVIERELHDCGIVYHPKQVYFICVMTKGDSFERLAQVIRDISKITYDYVSEN